MQHLTTRHVTMTPHDVMVIMTSPWQHATLPRHHDIIMIYKHLIVCAVPIIYCQFKRVKYKNTVYF